MLNLRIINDTHILGPDEFMNYSDVVYAATHSLYPVFLAGDVVDLVNCKNKDISLAFKYVGELFHLGEYISGNHDPIDRFIGGGKRESVIWDKILIAHGDEASWGVERSNKFREKEFGASWFKRNFISKPISNLRHLLAVRPNENHLAFVERKKKQYPILRHIILGHSHPSRVIHFEHLGVKCMILPQGINDIGLEL